ncbi:MAG: hypothetical protein AB7F50_12155 [Fimbriimonadaceae bacterium]
MREFLTVPDALWLNQRITGLRNAYHYARLEEAVFLQYTKGKNPGVLETAAEILAGFSRLAPFSRGNQATGVAAVLAFLIANGVRPAVASGSLAESAAFEGDSKAALSWLRGHTASASDGHGRPVADALDEVMAQFGADLARLDASEGDTPLVTVSAPRLSGEFVGA